MPQLFNRNVLKPYIEKHEIDNFDKKFEQIKNWKKNLQLIKNFNEIKLQETFLSAIFKDILDYTGFEKATGEWNVNLNPKTEIDATSPDGNLGFYSADAEGDTLEESTQVVIDVIGQEI